MRHTASTEGLHALYKGLPIALVGIIPFSAIDLGLYETLKAQILLHHSQDSLSIPQRGLTSSETLACGSVASLVAQVCTYPLALAKTRLQASGMAGQVQYRGLVDCLQRAWHAHGILGLFNGFTPNLLKALPSMSITYVVFESTKARLLRARGS